MLVPLFTAKCEEITPGVLLRAVATGSPITSPKAFVKAATGAPKMNKPDPGVDALIEVFDPLIDASIDVNNSALGVSGGFAGSTAWPSRNT
jgi:hypothetical protein